MCSDEETAREDRNALSFPLKFPDYAICFSTHIIFVNDGRAQLQKAQFISKFATGGNISSTSAKGNQFSFCR